MLDFERCYRAVKSKDRRFDGQFITAVSSTGIYCRPSCPAVTPRKENVRFYPTSAAAHLAGFRACKRCRPDASPGSPDWDVRRDAVGRAMRLIADGMVDRAGVEGLAERLGYSSRQLNRMLVQEVGAGPLAIARAHRAHTARTLLETTSLSITEIAFASGFNSIRQFNDTILEVFATTPSALRQNRSNGTGGQIVLRLPYREPLDAGSLFDFIGSRAVPGVEAYTSGVYVRSLDLPRGPGIASLEPADGYISCGLRLSDLRDLNAAVQRCRRLLDLDADPAGIAETLGRDDLLARAVKKHPGLRVPGHVSGAELAIRAVLGQQVSVAAARTLAGRMAETFGRTFAVGETKMQLFPRSEQIAEHDLTVIGMPKSRARALSGLASAIAGRDVVLDAGADPDEVKAKLIELPGIGPWTASYIAMRAVHDPDVLLSTDLGVRRGVEALGLSGKAKDVDALGERWRPWRSYATQYLWASLQGVTKATDSERLRKGDGDGAEGDANTALGGAMRR